MALVHSDALLPRELVCSLRFRSNQKDAVKYFGARMQSTLIAYKGATETGRSVGDTERGSIAALLDKTL